MKNAPFTTTLRSYSTCIKTVDPQGKKISGTGLFFNLRIKGKGNVPLLIANKHLVAETEKGSFSLPTTTQNGTPSKKPCVYAFEEGFSQHWIAHPNENIDLSILPLKDFIAAARRTKRRVSIKALSEKDLPKKSPFWLVIKDLLEEYKPLLA